MLNLTIYIFCTTRDIFTVVLIFISDAIYVKPILLLNFFKKKIFSHLFQHLGLVSSEY